MVVFAHVFAGGSWDVSLDITTTAERVSGRYGGDGVGDGISGMGGVEGPSGPVSSLPRGFSEATGEVLEWASASRFDDASILSMRTRSSSSSSGVTCMVRVKVRDYTSTRAVEVTTGRKNIGRSKRRKKIKRLQNLAD